MPFLLFLALIYFLSARLGQFLSIPPGNVTPLWPPSGIALAAFIIYGYRVWPGILLGAIVGTTWAFFDSSSLSAILKTSLAGTIIAIGITLQGVAGCYLIKRYIPVDQIFRKPINIIKFFILSILSCIISSVFGATTLALFGLCEWERYLTIWLTWIVGDSAGILIFTPFILVWFRHPSFKLTSSRLYEGIFLITLLLITARIVAVIPYNLAYLFIPFLIWGAFRFGLRGSTFILLIISLVANIITIFGLGPFVYNTRNASLIEVQFYIAVMGLTGLIMSSLLEQLDEYSQTLELKVEEKIHQLKEMQQKIIVQEKLSSLGLITAGIAHEIKNPLNFVNNFSALSLNLLKDLSQSLQSRLRPEENESIHLLNENVNSILEQGKKADGIIQKLLTLGTSAERNFKSIDLHQFLDETINLTYFAFKAKSSISVNIEKKYDRRVPEIKVVPDNLTRVLINILNNAFYAMEAKKNQTPSLSVTTKKLENSVEITIRDNGIGISKKDSKNIFTPFFTTKSPGQGVGLGLSLSRDVIVSEHSGKLYFRSEEGLFTEFIIELPI